MVSMRTYTILLLGGALALALLPAATAIMRLKS